MTAGALIRLVPGALDHVPLLAERLRAIDRIECAAMGLTGAEALTRGVLTSAVCWTALVDGEPQAMFGVVIECAAGGDGVPWFLGSDCVAAHGRALLRQGPGLIAAMHRHARTLRNYVSADNAQAIGLLEHWGFSVATAPILIRGLPFRRFIRETE